LDEGSHNTFVQDEGICCLGEIIGVRPEIEGFIFDRFRIKSDAERGESGFLASSGVKARKFASIDVLNLSEGVGMRISALKQRRNLDSRLRPKQASGCDCVCIKEFRRPGRKRNE
jgi:hypothetical protein